MADSIQRAREGGLLHIAPVLDGQEMAHSGGDVVEVINPATGKPVARQACCDDGDVDQLVQSAQRAYRGDAWRKLTPSARGVLLLKYADVIEKYAEELIELELLDTGKPIGQLRGGELPLAAAIIRFYAGAADKIEGAVKATSSGSFDLTFWEPYGVVAGILPWNYPLVNVAMKLAPALAAGNAIILKPSIETPLAAVAMGKLCRDAGIPDGIVNVALGAGSQVGNALVTHRQVKKISFTGSTQVGQAIQRQAAEQMKAVNLELGGKNAIVVFDDADLERAADAVVFSAFVNAGQLCVSCSRLLVQESIADRFEQLLVEKVKQVKVGDPRDEATLVGPMITQSQYDTAMRYIEAGKGEGCRVLCGGGAAQPGGDLGGGYWLTTTILSGCRPNMKVAKEEIFGPALAVMRFKDEADAIDIANGVSYGLSGSIWTRHSARALRMVRAMDTGLIWVNTMLAGYPQIPLAPHKMSGTGVELGIEGLLAYCKRKSAILAYDDDAPVGWGLASS